MAFGGFVRAGVAVAVCAVLAGCSSGSSSGASSGASSATVPSGDVVVTPAASPPAADVTTINGEVPPGTPTAVDESITKLDVIDDDIEHLVYQDTRSPGTRSPIHEHPYGGTTCVISGEMTLFLQGSEPQVAHEGDCYWMPPGLPMTGSNTGVDYAVMIDTFAVPPGQPVWWVVEPGQEDTADEFGGGGGGGHM